MFHGLSAFPLPPTDEDGVDESAVAELVAQLDRAGVDSIGALGSPPAGTSTSRESSAAGSRRWRSGQPGTPRPGRDRVARLRAVLPDRVTIGVSGDPAGAGGLLAGCDAWYSVLGGLWPQVCLAITRAARAGDDDGAHRLSDRLTPLWELFARHGSLRVVSAIAEQAGLIGTPHLPRPLLPLPAEARRRVAAVVDDLGPELSEPSGRA